MKKFIQNYKSTIILILAMVIGCFVGLIFKEKASILKPFGTIFLNMLFIVIVPLIFLTVTTSIAKLNKAKRISKIAKSIAVVFVATSIVAVAVGVATTYNVPLVNSENKDAITAEMAHDAQEPSEDLNILERTVEVLTVEDFNELLTKDNIIALLIVSVMIGIAMNMSKKESEPLLKILLSANHVVMNLIKIIMYYAPIGIACYFASFIGTFGASLAVGYAKTFIIYLVVSLAFFAIIYTLYAYLAGGKKGIKVFWKNAITPTVTSLATCSSAACIPVNVTAAKNIGVSDDIAETMIPLGTSFHKDGSIIGSVFKIMFLVALFGMDATGGSALLQIIVVALLANLLVTAVPIGGGTISEVLIISMMGFPMGALPFLTIVATIIDVPATMLNVVGDTSSSMLAARMIDGPNWMDKKDEE